MLGMLVTNPDISHRFVPGHEPRARYPLGATRVNSMGYIDVKVAPGKVGAWKSLHRENWKKKYGKYPPPAMSISFKDGNKHNCDVDNLYLISKQDALRKVSINIMPAKLRDLIRLKGRLNLMINNRRKKNENV